MDTKKTVRMIDYRKVCKRKIREIIELKVKTLEVVYEELDSTLSIKKDYQGLYKNEIELRAEIKVLRFLMSEL